MDHQRNSLAARLSIPPASQAVIKQSQEPDLFSNPAPSLPSSSGSRNLHVPRISAPVILPPWKRRRLDDLAEEDTIGRIRHAFSRARAGNFDTITDSVVLDETVRAIKEAKQQEPDAALLEDFGSVWLKLSHRLSLAGFGADDAPRNILWLALPPPTDGEVAIRHARDLGAVFHQVERYGGVPLYKSHMDLAPRLWFALRADDDIKEDLAGQRQITAATASGEEEDELERFLMQHAEEATENIQAEKLPDIKKDLGKENPDENTSVKDADDSSFGPFSPRKTDSIPDSTADVHDVPATPTSPVSRKRIRAFTPPHQIWPKTDMHIATTNHETIVIEDDDDDDDEDGCVDNNNKNNNEDVGALEEADEVDMLMDEADSQVFPLTVEEECALWQKACRFFGHEPAACDPQNPEHQHRVAGLRLGLRPDQMWSVFRMLSAQALTGLHGTLLADGFGLGKTLQATAVAVLAALVHMAKIEVQKEWSMCREGDYPKQKCRHLPPSTIHPQTDTAECPSGTYRLGFACPCVERLPTYDIMDTVPGPGALFIVPPVLLPHWTTQLVAYVEDDGDELGKSFFQLVCVRPGDSAKSLTPEARKRFLVLDAISAGQPACGPFLSQITNVVPVSRNKKKKDKDGKSGNGYLLSSHTRVPCPLVVVPSSSALANMFKISSTVSQIQQANRRQGMDSGRGVEIHKRMLQTDVPFPFQPSMVFIDEAHKVKGKDTVLWQVVRQLVGRSRYPLFVYPCSATPTPKDANDLESFVDILVKPPNNSSNMSLSLSPPSSSSSSDLYWRSRGVSEREKLNYALQAWHKQSRSLVAQMEALSRGPSSGQTVHDQQCQARLRKQAFLVTTLRLMLFRQVAVARCGSHRFLGQYTIQQLPMLCIEERPCPTPDADGVRARVVALGRNVASEIRTRYHEYLKLKASRKLGLSGSPGRDGAMTLEEFASHRGPGESLTLFYDLHLCAVFPALAGFMRAATGGDLGSAACKDVPFTFRRRDFVYFPQPQPNDVHAGPSWTASPYWPYIDVFSAHSSKLEALYGILDAMLVDRSSHRLPLQVQGQTPKKTSTAAERVVVLAKRAVVFTARPTVAYLVALALHHHYGARLPVTLMMDTANPNQRRQLLAPFEGPVVANNNANPVHDDISRVLVATIGISAEGLDLTRASYAVILEPYWNHDQERQALGRVQRTGQYAAETHLYKLVCTDNIAERLVQCRQMGRRAATQGWDMQEALGAFLRE